MRELFVKRLVFSFNLMVVSTRSWSLPMSAPGKDLVFALLMRDLKCWSVRIKSHLVVNLPIRGIPGCCWGGECRQGWVCDSLRTLWVSILCRLSLQCQIFLLSLPSVGIHQGLLWHSNRLELQVHPSWESLLWCYQAADRTVRGPTLVRGPEWLWCCMVSPRSGWRWVCWRWECS